MNERETVSRKLFVDLFGGTKSSRKFERIKCERISVANHQRKRNLMLRCRDITDCSIGKIVRSFRAFRVYNANDRRDKRGPYGRTFQRESTHTYTRVYIRVELDTNVSLLRTTRVYTVLERSKRGSKARKQTPLPSPHHAILRSTR